MKLILAILRDPHHENIKPALITAGFRVTLVASTSGWLKKGVTTLLIGVDDNQVDQALDVIRKNCPAHTEAGSHNATLFVLKTFGFEHF
jgi:uncharacterized protein YaaQ